MPNNLTDLALEALAYIFASGTSAGQGNQATISNATLPQKRRLASDLTATMQEIYDLAPAIYKTRLGAALAAAVTGNITVTSGETVCTTAVSYVSGSTVNVGGIYNQIFLNADGDAELVFPYVGTSGTVQATFYGDCIPLPDTVERLIGPVYLADSIRLEKRVNRQDFNSVTLGSRGYGDYGRRRINLDVSRPLIGTPLTYWVEPSLSVGATNHTSNLWLRVSPIPRAAVEVSFDVRLRSPRFEISDLESEDAPSDRTLVVASDYVESLVRPIFLARWANSPWFKDREARKALQDDAATARARLLAKRPQQPSNRRITAPI